MQFCLEVPRLDDYKAFMASRLARYSRKVVSRIHSLRLGEVRSIDNYVIINDYKNNLQLFMLKDGAFDLRNGSLIQHRRLLILSDTYTTSLGGKVLLARLLSGEDIHAYTIQRAWQHHRASLR